jgi:ABC-type phosphate/phosphonate transport system substrate-binding protein
MAGSAAAISFGLMWQKKDEPVGHDFAEFTAWLSRASGVPLVPRCALSYEELDRIIGAGEVGVAWVPPIVYLRLERAGAVDPLVTHTRAAGVTYESVLIVHTDSNIRALDGLRGARAAWVDPWSAAGYVLPRIKLATLGMDPRETFREERFCGSHDAAVRAVLDRSADVAGTYARRNAEGNLVRAGWTEMPEAGGRVHVLTSFGPIPGDLIVAHRSLAARPRQALVKALLSVEKDAIAPLVRKIFGIQRFREGGVPSFGALRRALDGAVARGLWPQGEPR